MHTSPGNLGRHHAHYNAGSPRFSSPHLGHDWTRSDPLVRTTRQVVVVYKVGGAGGMLLWLAPTAIGGNPKARRWTNQTHHRDWTQMGLRAGLSLAEK